MSFFSNFSSDHCPGSISGNPLNGLCEKVCIQAEKIFDAGIVQTRLENYTLAPENEFIDYNLSRAYRALGDLPEARISFARAERHRRKPL